MSQKWHQIPCSGRELQLLGTLNGGQSFRWKKNINDDWIGVVNNKVWVLRQTDTHLLYQVHEPQDSIQITNDNDEYLKKYFHLNYSIQDYYSKWSTLDKYFKLAAEQFYGIRILRQEVVENIFSFICSSNNNIKRISSMVEKLATFYGNVITSIDDQEYYGFPEVESLAAPGVEEKLKANGFGYRAKYISKSARTIVENGGQKWIDQLKAMSYEEAKKNLMTLTGIGAKVADCICLMSLGHLQAIPVDTHIYQIATRFYMPHLAKQKTVTEKVYNEIGIYFRDLYGPLAGWAHTVLFCADLKQFGGREDKKGKKRKQTEAT